MATNSNQLVNGACIAAGAALAIADFPLIGAAIAAVGAYRAVKDGTNPLAAVSLFAWDTALDWAMTCATSTGRSATDCRPLDCDRALVLAFASAFGAAP